ncbi:hypothetical protein PHYBOEH_001675 [Phytophthora boehmeriae]|uniref:Uncharacterized protein n=1 Tax=Phytophthora boehmeriae TaxID=109152 RepID=A0A8T1WTG0_9STRA|nr:hypothetical protein PHYBOEH_001675 [Phytophthora boehmeriae]
MSAYLQGYDMLSGSYLPQSHYLPPLSAGPLAAYDSDDDAFSSDFDVLERDIDAEIEARERQAHRYLAPPSEPEPEPRTLSQRMLHSLQLQRQQSRAAAELAPRGAVRGGMGDSMYDLRSAVRDDESVVSTERLTAAFNTPISSRSGSSCTDRLEARISRSFLDNKKPGEAGRRTYPAESVRTTEHSRLSERDAAATPQETKMLSILEKERAARVFRSQRSNPEVPKVKESGVRFHFRRGASVDIDAVNGRMGRLTLHDTNGVPDRQSALVRSRPAGRVTDPEYTRLASQLAEIETLVDEIAVCMKAPAFSTLAEKVLKEMELLTKTTQQIRTTGTTLILASMGKQQSDFAQALRRLVSRAASVQQRIGWMMQEVKELVA